MKRRHELQDWEWAVVEPLLPPQRPARGRPGKSHREMLDAMFWLARSGASWRDLPERYGPWKSVSTRFYRWRDSGLFGRLLAALQAAADARGELDWSAHMVDSTIIRAHQHAAGARRGKGRGAKGGRKQSALGAAGAASRPSCT